MLTVFIIIIVIVILLLLFLFAGTYFCGLLEKSQTLEPVKILCQTVYILIILLHNLRWLDTVFLGQYLLSLSINYVAINKVLEKLPPQLY